MLTKTSVNFNNRPLTINQNNSNKSAKTNFKPTFGINHSYDTGLARKFISKKHAKAFSVLKLAIEKFSDVHDVILFKLAGVKDHLTSGNVNKKALKVNIENLKTGLQAENVIIKNNLSVKNYTRVKTALGEVMAPSLVDFLTKGAGLHPEFKASERVIIDKNARKALSNEHFQEYIDDVEKFKQNIKTALLNLNNSNIAIRAESSRNHRNLVVFAEDGETLFQMSKKHSPEVTPESLREALKKNPNYRRSGSDIVDKRKPEIGD